MDNTNSGLKKILVIDDEGDLLNLVGQRLKSLPCRIVINRDRRGSPQSYGLLMEDTLRRNRQPSDRQSCIATVNAY